MSDVICPKCGAALRWLGSGRGWREENPERCVSLRGTPYADPSNAASGLSWCPDLAAASPPDVLLQGTSHRDEVLAAIEVAKGNK